MAGKIEPIRARPIVYPASFEAERAVIAALLTNKESVPVILASVLTEDFTHPAYKLLYGVVQQLFHQDVPIDVVTVSIEYRKREAAPDVTISDLFKEEFSADYPVHVRAVKYHAECRRVQITLAAAQDKIGSMVDIDTIKAEVVNEFARTGNSAGKNPIRWDNVLTLMMKRVEKAMDNKDAMTGIPTNFRDFDRKIGGLYPGDLIIVADRPSGGKSALLLGFAMGAAKRGFPSMIVNAEMSAEDVATRAVAGPSGIENYDIRRGHLSDEDIPKIRDAAAGMGDLPIWVYDDTHWELIKSQIRALKNAHPELAVVVIDYLTLLRVEPLPHELRYQLIGRITKDAKVLARDLGIAVVMAAQISRNVAKEEKEPDLSDLRECGDIEQDADVVIFIHRFKKKEWWKAYLLIKKNRNGPIGSVPLRWTAADVAFTDWNPDE